MWTSWYLTSRPVFHQLRRPNTWISYLYHITRLCSSPKRPGPWWMLNFPWLAAASAVPTPVLCSSSRYYPTPARCTPVLCSSSRYCPTPARGHEMKMLQECHATRISNVIWDAESIGGVYFYVAWGKINVRANYAQLGQIFTFKIFF